MTDALTPSSALNAATTSASSAATFTCDMSDPSRGIQRNDHANQLEVTQRRKREVRFLSAQDLVEAVDGDGDAIMVAHTSYELVSMLAPDRVDPFLTDNPGMIACRIPIRTIISKLSVNELKDLCRLHNIPVVRDDVRANLLNKITAHGCGDTCEQSFAIVEPRGQDNDTMGTDIFEQTFPETCKVIKSSVLRTCDTNSAWPESKKGFRLAKVRPGSSISQETNTVSIVNIDLTFLAEHLTVKGLRALARAHDIPLPSCLLRPVAIDLIGNHRCILCPDLVFDFVPHAPSAKQPKNRASAQTESLPFFWPDFESRVMSDYPPKPTSVRQLASIMAGYCAELTPQAVEESACAVCGQLVKRTDLSPIDEIHDKLHVLEECGVTQSLRRSPESPLIDIGGPVILQGVNDVCSDCKHSLSREHRPQTALANYLWLGEVPDELKDLTLAEQTLISRVRFNQCVVRISNGHAKMVANVIAFEHPSVKIYDKLPIDKEDLSDILAVFFTGITPPTEDDLKRTPVIVRRKKVKEALEWLTLNHRNYTDLNIDYDTLNKYPLEDIPVQVVHQQTHPDDGNVIPAAQSQFDNETEMGTESGPCSYSVHGLTAERFATMSSLQRKTAGLQHLRNGGGVLAVGHSSTPQSMYDNPSLYPQMFPHLFPYGHGGLGQEQHNGLISKETHLKWFLLYHDKRFQLDASFLIVAFNHQLIKQGTSGSFMMIKRKNFAQIAEGIRTLNPNVLASISERMKSGSRVVPSTPAEQQCFSLLDQIEYVGGHVKGSVTSKKQQRNEVWALIAFNSTPQWFLTFSPCDNKHPLCIYYSGYDMEFRPKIMSASARELLITRNPVACARFFDFIVKLFIKHVCGWGNNNDTQGVFGKPSAYYGTVEQQGRMTLHLHFLLWIDGALSPQQIRERLMSGDSEFQCELTEYLESCQVGEFLTGTHDEVKAKVPCAPKTINKGIHTLYLEADRPQVSVPKDYIDPTLTLPEPPPTDYCPEAEDGECTCEGCTKLESWYHRFKAIFDDILIRSNVHKCFGRRDNDKDKSNQGSNGDNGERVPRQHRTGKGCVNKDGKCTARFPRDVHEETTVDAKTGHISLKKKEPWINNVTPVVTVTNRCNTDTTCLQSGTGLKATIGYITDYLTKFPLKTYQIFSTMFDVYHKEPTADVEEGRESHAARKMILRIVNSLSAKMEFGAPMAALYLLGNPDHYTSHESQIFYWKNFVNFVEREWKTLLDQLDNPDEAMEEDIPNPTPNGVDFIEGSEESSGGTGDNPNADDNVLLGRSNGNFTSKASTDDYCFRPREHENITLYKWVQCSVRFKDHTNRSPDKTLQFYHYLPEHSMHGTHLVACDPDRRYTVMPNFLGPTLPRKDKGDRNYYCMTMLTLFKPWRTGLDLKGTVDSWEGAFEVHPFSPRQRQLMANFNLRYECYEARDDFSSMFKPAGKNTPGEEDSDDEGQTRYCADGDQGRDEDLEETELVQGPACQEMVMANRKTLQSLKSAGWRMTEKVSDTTALYGLKLPRVAIDATLDSTAWRRIVKAEKDRLWNRRTTALSGNGAPGLPDTGEEALRNAQVRDDVFVASAAYLSKEFVPQNLHWGTVMTKVEKEFSLNEQQKKAFRIVVNHATCIMPEQLLMYLGGMGGTGKSRVIKALVRYFERRNEPYRFVLLAPTGTAAALIGGSTYHSFLGINTGKGGGGSSLGAIEDVKTRMSGVGYILMDEHSMLSSVNNCRISARCCEVFQEFDKPYGGLNVIYCGDFAQLPPVRGLGMYSRKIGMIHSPRQEFTDQENTIGKLIWHQFTTVVILTENMRQIDDSTPEESAFRQALLNLRYHACTAEDLALIRSRVPAINRGLSMNDPEFREVSIITAWNRDKDQINDSSVVRFANETGQTLYEFFSIDTLSTSDPPKRPKNAKRIQRVYSKARYISSSDQQGLWSQPPHTSDHVAGCLRLCYGLPVLIRNNDATELCITNGQEARVVGWTCNPIPGFAGKATLDVLFVELVKPPHAVKIPHLPLNVVPLTKMSHSVEARLPSDEYMRLSRMQVPILPNFAMTDYSAQGKTREYNVVDITNCKGFQGAYTCLSRGTTLGGTLVMRNFEDVKLTGVLDGELRQEYRELSYLDAITTLRYEGNLPEHIMLETRRSTIAAYRRWKTTNEEDTWHPTIREERPEDLPFVREDGRLNMSHVFPPNKRKSVFSDQRRPLKRTKKNDPPQLSTGLKSPIGPNWDGHDHSCAFDAWVFVLYFAWKTGLVSDAVSELSPSLTLLVDEYKRITQGQEEGVQVTRVRDIWRKRLREGHPDEDVHDKEGADVVTLSRLLLGHELENELVTTECARCSKEEPRPDLAELSLSQYNGVGDYLSIQKWLDARLQSVGECTTCQGDTYIAHDLPDLLCVSVMGETVTMDWHVSIERANGYRLVGAIYYGGGHFVSRVVTTTGKVYSHDGIDGASSVFEGFVGGDDFRVEDLIKCGNREAIACIYVRASNTA